MCAHGHVAAVPGRHCWPVSLPRTHGCILPPLAMARDFHVSRQDSTQISGQS